MPRLYLDDRFPEVRKGNPKGIKDWDDLIDPAWRSSRPIRKTSGERALELSRRLGLRAECSLRLYADKAKAIRRRSLQERPGAGYRGARLQPHVTFVERGVGDVLLAWESEAFPGAAPFKQGQVRDRLAAALDPGRAASSPSSIQLPIRKARGPWPKPDPRYWYTKEGQEIAARQFLSSPPPEIAKEYENSFAKVEFIAVDDVFGGWTKAQKELFGEGGVFDQIYKELTGRPNRGPWREHKHRRTAQRTLPGFGLTIGLTLTWLSVIVLIPLAGLFLKDAEN